MADLIVKSAVKDALDENNVSADFYEALDDEVAELLEDATRRAESNDQKPSNRATCNRRAAVSFL